MKHLLTEKEYKELVSNGLHEKACKRYQEEIDELNSVITLTGIKIKLKSGEGKNNLEMEDISFLYSHIRNKAIDIIFSLAKKYKKKIRERKHGPLKFTIDYDVDWAGLWQAQLGSIDSKERTILDDNEDKIAVEDITTDSLLNLAIYLEKYGGTNN